MAKFRPYWHIILLLIIMSLQLSQAVPCSNINSIIGEQERNVGRQLAAPSKSLQPQAANLRDVSRVSLLFRLRRSCAKLTDALISYIPQY
jgi:hypothetical protein